MFVIKFPTLKMCLYRAATLYSYCLKAPSARVKYVAQRPSCFRDKLQLINSVKRSVFDLTKIPFLKRLISISRLIVEVLNDQNLSTESNLANWFSSYVQFCLGGHFSERVAAVR